MSDQYWALIVDGTVSEVTNIDPAGRFPPPLRWLSVPRRIAPWVTNAYVETEHGVQPPTLDFLRGQVRDAVTAERWQHEIAGLTLPDGTRILTAQDDQQRVNSVLTNMERYGIAEVDFKTASGWRRASYEDVKQIGDAIMRHVQAGFTAERAHHAAIDALDSAEAVATYDYSAGWPGSEA
ncbi:DUF4376 domain-containing protein [Microvirgula aerodenitrificans]|uniref:DUF4376 domain-containing protein n=1 Tax=Microvirgula aerodenitrificans TaxID=57480 RepID=UPI00056072D6|nr:DUF4376 domain-containing protein [Microvirgula aerodenitrificans]